MVIEDKKLGLKIAENKDEAFYNELRDSTAKELERLEKLTRFNKDILWLCKIKLEKLKGGRNGN
jgi:hypothetical protein